MMDVDSQIRRFTPAEWSVIGFKRRQSVSSGSSGRSSGTAGRSADGDPSAPFAGEPLDLDVGD
jgi:hypothetical protein